MKKLILPILLLMGLCLTKAQAIHAPEFSTAGFFSLAHTGRNVYSMNPAWRFHRGANRSAEQVTFDDSGWSVVSLPHGIEYLPTEASGCINYQGEVWYRKHFTPSENLRGRKLFLHFEAIMGKSKVYVNGKLLKEHFGGYLPVIIDVTKALQWGKDNVIAIWADNSDDPSYPPGKPQGVLDYTYFGGIYRDCWLIAHNTVYLTDPNYEKEVAGGGVFVAFGKVSESEAEISLKAQVRNERSLYFKGRVEYILRDPSGKEAGKLRSALHIAPGSTSSVTGMIKVKHPGLWSPASPTLYNMEVRVTDAKGTVVDGYRKRIGIRSIEFKGKEGFWLNGKPYGKPLIGGNRHQDFAVVGNAVSNNAHWRDALKLRRAGMEVIRNAHCPQDPAFMDACDELGLFVIDNIPGWQFWNDAPIFAQRVYEDIRNLVRRDRNHACLWLWEPILNETYYPADFAQKCKAVVGEEYPYPYSYSASDMTARGSEAFSVLFSHPPYTWDGSKQYDETKTYFTREWGDNVDDWGSHNSPSRVARNWGEEAMRTQALHYAKPDYAVTNFDILYRQSPQFVGGCLWHSFDHQRGYHPDPFYGGLMDVFRQPKYAYYMFMAQRPAEVNQKIAGSGPMVFIAHEMTPFSGKDVTVYSNCEEVRLTFLKGGKTYTYHRKEGTAGMPSPIITFRNVYDFMKDKELAMKGRGEEVFLLAEGVIKGKVVATHRVAPARRPEKIILWVDRENTSLKADGSDFVTVIAAIADKDGRIKRLNNDYIRFSIEGEGRILGGADILANPAPVKWGTAPILVQSTLTPGKIRIKASVLFNGINKPLSGEVELESTVADIPLIYEAKEAALIPRTTGNPTLQSAEDQKSTPQQLEQIKQNLKAVEQQQADFGE